MTSPGFLESRLSEVRRTLEGVVLHAEDGCAVDFGACREIRRIEVCIAKIVERHDPSANISPDTA